MLNFTWDEQKNIENFKKHGVWFDEAQTVWTDPAAEDFLDGYHSDDEDRYIRVGHSTRNRLLLVVYCERVGDVIRIISARKATARERKDYEEGI